MRKLWTVGLQALSCAVLLLAQDLAKRNGEEGRLLALESAWNHAEVSKDAAALNQLLGESLVYVDYDGTLQNKKQTNLLYTHPHPCGDGGQHPKPA